MSSKGVSTIRARKQLPLPPIETTLRPRTQSVTSPPTSPESRHTTETLRSFRSPDRVYELESSTPVSIDLEFHDDDDGMMNLLPASPTASSDAANQILGDEDIVLQPRSPLASPVDLRPITTPSLIGVMNETRSSARSSPRQTAQTQIPKRRSSSRSATGVRSRVDSASPKVPRLSESPQALSNSTRSSPGESPATSRSPPASHSRRNETSDSSYGLVSPSRPTLLPLVLSSPRMTTDSPFQSLRSSDDDTKAFRPHSKYFFGDGNILVSVQDTIYKVHSYIFRESEILRPIFDRKSDSRGMSPYNHGPLDQDVLMTTDDFDCFLSTLYPSYPPRSFSNRDLLAVLRLADLWAFNNLKNHTLAQLKRRELSTPDKLELGATHHDEELLLEAFVSLCITLCPPDRLTFEVISTLPSLGFESIAALVQARERVRQHLYALLEREERIDNFRDCLNRVEPCHSASDFHDALHQAFFEPLPEPRQVDGYILAKTSEDRELCAYCKMQAQTRVRHFLEYDEIERLVCGLMMPKWWAAPGGGGVQSPVL